MIIYHQCQCLHLDLPVDLICYLCISGNQSQKASRCTKSDLLVVLCLGEAEGPEAWGTFDVYPSERICRVGVHLCELCYGPPIGLEHLGEAWTSMNYSPPLRDGFVASWWGMEWAWVCYTCELCHCKPQASSLKWGGTCVGQGANDSQLSPPVGSRGNLTHMVHILVCLKSEETSRRSMF